MYRESDVLEFVRELSESTGLRVYLGLNVFVTPPPPLFDQDGEGYRVKVDPTAFTFEEEDKIKRFAEMRGLVIEDYWNDWGRYLKIWKRHQMTEESITL